MWIKLVLYVIRIIILTYKETLVCKYHSLFHNVFNTIIAKIVFNVIKGFIYKATNANQLQKIFKTASFMI